MKTRALLLGRNDGRAHRLLQFVHSGRSDGSFETWFVTTSAEALDLLRSAPFGVIVAEVEAPNVSGRDFLALAHGEQPGAARLLLSPIDVEPSTMKVDADVHRTLSETLSDEDLWNALVRTCNLHTLLRTEALNESIGNLTKLPSVSQTFQSLMSAFADPNAGMKQFAQVIEKDSAMTLKVLQLANSALFGRSRRVTTVQHAVASLGIEVLRSLVLTAQVFAAAEHGPIKGFSIEKFHDRSLRVAQLARTFLAGRKSAEEAYTVGMILDIGKMILGVTSPDEFAAIAKRAAETSRPWHELEAEVMGITHAALGACFVAKWGLPYTIVESIAFHHDPREISSGPCDVLAAVYAADMLLDCAESGGSEERLDVAFLERAGFVDQLPRWRDFVAKELERDTGDLAEVPA